MKRGGSKMGYAEQFNLLSPCYKQGEEPAGWHMGGVKPTKKGKPTKKAIKAKSSTTKKAKSSKQKGGSSCYASPSVSEMGVHDRPASLELTASERAWDNRMKGGGPNGSNTTKTQTNQLNNVSTYLNKLKDVVFDKDMTGFAIVVERTSEHASNSKQDKYKIKVIKIKNNTPTMNVLADKSFSDVLQTVRETSSDTFPLKKQGNNNPIETVNYSIPNSNLAAAETKNGNRTANGTAAKNGNGTANGTAAKNGNGTAAKNGNGTTNGITNGTRNKNGMAAAAAAATATTNLFSFS
jgi:hypothetical protein